MVSRTSHTRPDDDDSALHPHLFVGPYELEYVLTAESHSLKDEAHRTLSVLRPTEIFFAVFAITWHIPKKVVVLRRVLLAIYVLRPLVNMCLIVLRHHVVAKAHRVLCAFSVHVDAFCSVCFSPGKHDIPIGSVAMSLTTRGQAVGDPGGTIETRVNLFENEVPQCKELCVALWEAKSSGLDQLFRCNEDIFFVAEKTVAIAVQKQTQDQELSEIHLEGKDARSDNEAARRTEDARQEPVGGGEVRAVKGRELLCSVVKVVYSRDSESHVAAVSRLCELLRRELGFRVEWDEAVMHLAHVTPDWAMAMAQLPCPQFNSTAKTAPTVKMLVIESDGALLKHQAYRNHKDLGLVSDSNVDELYHTTYAALLSNHAQALGHYCHIMVARLPYTTLPDRLDLVPEKRYQLPEHLPLLLQALLHKTKLPVTGAELALRSEAYSHFRTALADAGKFHEEKGFSEDSICAKLRAILAQ
ncbi:hypothetical protein MRX96_051508 [Rhipicephalus microplus]